MRWNGFLGSILFGAFAAFAYQPTLLLFGPSIGYRAAAAGFLIVAAASYVAGLVAEPRRGLTAAVLVGFVVTVAAALTRSPPLVAVVAMAAVGFVRSAMLYEMPFGRALFVELVLLGGSAVLGSYLIAQGPLGGAMAVWGVFLVQSIYFLSANGSTTSRARTRAPRDPFEAARARAYALLDG